MARKSKTEATATNPIDTIEITLPANYVRQRTRPMKDEDDNPVYETDENGDIVLNAKGEPKQAREPMFYPNSDDPMMEIYKIHMSDDTIVQSLPVVTVQGTDFKGVQKEDGTVTVEPKSYKCEIDKNVKAKISVGEKNADGDYIWKNDTVTAEEAVEGISKNREDYEKKAPKASFTVGVDNIKTNGTTGNRFANVYLDENTRISVNLPKDAEVPETGSYTFEVPANYTANLQKKDPKTGHYDRTEDKISYADASEQAAEDWENYQKDQKAKYAEQDKMRDEAKGKEDAERQAAMDELNARIEANKKKAETAEKDDSSEFCG